MRIAATLVHALPGVRVRLRHDGAVMLEVPDAATGSGPAIGACAFRRAVASAHEQTKAGIRLAFMGMPEGAEPAVDIGVPPGDAVLPVGVYRVALGDRTVHGFATTLPRRHCREVLAALPDSGHELRLHHDAATEVTFVHTVSPSVAAPPDAAHLAPALEALVAAEVALELAGVG